MLTTMQSLVAKPIVARHVPISTVALRPALPLRAGARYMRRAVQTHAVDSKEDTELADELSSKATEVVDKVKNAWDNTEEKPAVIAITAVSFVAVWAASALIDGIDKLPLLGGFFELVGLIVTAWFVYRYLLFGPDREELKKNIDSFFAKVAGK